MLRRFEIAAAEAAGKPNPIDFLKKSARRANLNSLNGGIAQLVERLVRNEFWTIIPTLSHVLSRAFS